MILVELTEAQRSIMVRMVHARMDAMREADPSSWMTPEYAAMEGIVYALVNNCAD